MPHLYDLNPHLAPKDWKSKAAPKKSVKGPRAWGRARGKLKCPRQKER